MDIVFYALECKPVSCHQRFNTRPKEMLLTGFETVSDGHL